MAAAFRELLEALIEKTDLMYQSLKVDDVEVFLSALEERENLIAQLGTYEMNLRSLKMENEGLVEKLLILEKHIEPEMKQCQKRMKKSISDVQLERMKLKQNSVKASRYIAPSQFSAGNYFDNKK